METEEHEAPNDIEDPVLDSPLSNIQREEHPYHVSYFVDPLEPAEPSERPIFAPHVKRRPAWLRETL